MRILEQYIINRFGENFTIRLYKNGEYRCSCQKFHAFGFSGECSHVKAVKNNTANFVEAQRFEAK